MPPPGIEPATPCIPACPSNHSAIGRDIDMLLELLQYFFEETILQELCIVYKRYIKNKNKRTLFSYTFVIDTIEIQDDLYKKEFFYVFYVNDYI